MRIASLDKLCSRDGRDLTSCSVNTDFPWDTDIFQLDLELLVILKLSENN